MADLPMRYRLDDVPPRGELLLLALQWVAVSLPFVAIAAGVAGAHHFADAASRTVYLQKAVFVTGLMFLSQAFLGHRLTLVGGPSTALLLGILGSSGTPDAVYTASAVAGLVLAAVGALGLFGRIRALFTRRVVAAVVLLIAFTMTPTIVRLLTGGNGVPSERNLAFAAVFTASLFVLHRLLPPVGRSLLLLGGIVAGSLLYSVIFSPATSGVSSAPFGSPFSALTKPELDPGVLLSTLFCFLALAINEIGSIESVGPLLQAEGMERRQRRGMTVTGAVNAAAGFLGVIGPVDYSLSPGVIAATGSASRIPLLPAGALLFLLAFSPAALALAAAIPAPVVGAILLYTLAGQVAAGMGAVSANGTFEFEDGLVIGAALLAGTVGAWLPPAAVAALPEMLRPLAGNGFVIGVAVLLVMDRIFRATR